MRTDRCLLIDTHLHTIIDRIDIDQPSIIKKWCFLAVTAEVALLVGVTLVARTTAKPIRARDENAFG